MNPADSSLTNGEVAPRLRWRAWSWLLLAVGISYVAIFAFYPKLFPYFGVNYFGVWFLDSFAILASNDALTKGLGVYEPNPLDFFQRPHVYTHWWLELRRLGLTRADNFGVGLVLMLAFFIGALTKLRPQSARELGWYLLLLCSSPVLLAVHRANNDLLIFVLFVPLVPCLVRSGMIARVLAVILIAVATALKFYPGVAFLLLLNGTDEWIRRRGLVCGALAIVALAIDLAPDLVRRGALASFTKAEGLMTFGGSNLLSGLGANARFSLVVAGVLGMAIAAVFWRSRWLATWKVTPAYRASWLNFILGAVLLTGCFFSGPNFAYRWIFALGMAPFLWQVRHDVAAPLRVRRFATLTGALLVVCLWADTFAAAGLTFSAGKVSGEMRVRWADGWFLAEQPFTWAFFACLIGWLVHFAREELRWRATSAESSFPSQSPARSD